MLDPLKPQNATRLFLVGWDAADWKWLNPLLDAGELPALNQIVEHGVAGELLACQPLDTATVWTAIATGKRPWQHGVHHSREFDPQKQQPVPVSRKQRCVSTLWEMLADKNLRSLVVGWPATHGSESSLAKIVSDRFSEPTAPPGVKPWPPAGHGTYAPDSLREILDAVRVNPMDIGADVIARHVPDWRKMDQKTDRRLGQLRVLLSVDISHFTAAVQLMQHGAWDFAAVRFPALGHLARIFLPFQAPRRPWITEHEFDCYHDVIRIACRALDQMLGHLCQLAGPGATILLVSGHGTRVPNVPPAGFPPNSEHGWKSPYGLFAASGPALKQDVLLHGATVLDIAPTALALLGQPIGEDMEGRVLVESCETVPSIQRVESWDKPRNKSDLSDANTVTSPVAQGIRQAADWNCVQSCLEAGRLDLALPRLQNLFRSFPENAEFCHALFQCQLNLGKLEEAQATLEVLLETVRPGIATLLPQAELALAKRDVKQARAHVVEARRLQPAHPADLRRLGILLLRLREWNTVAELARAALEHDESDPIVWLGLAEASLRQN